MVFETWLRHAIAVLSMLKVRGEATQGTTAIALLTAILKLMAHCNLIDTRDKLIVMKERRGVDWDQCLKEVRIIQHFGVNLAKNSWPHILFSD